MDTENKEFEESYTLKDYIDKVNTVLQDGLCSTILYGHLKAIAKRCGINPYEYNDSASLTCAIADVLDERLASPDKKVLFIEQYGDGTSFIQYGNGWSYGYQNLLHHKERTEKINEDIIRWTNDNGGIEKIERYVPLGKTVEELAYLLKD